MEQPTLADINNDGKKDIIVAYGEYIYVFNENGSYLEGWPKKIDTQCEWEALMQKGPAVADLDKNGFKEIVVGDNCGYLHVLNHNGTYLEGWPKNFYTYIDTISIEDINQDRNLEIIFGDWWSYLHVVDINGNYLEGFPQRFYIDTAPYFNMIFSGVVIGDVNDDSYKELIVVAEGCTTSTICELKDKISRIYVLDYQGNILPGWPKEFERKIKVILGDLNNDNQIEIVVGGTRGISIYSGDGLLVESVLIEDAEYIGWNGLSIGDINKNGKTEIAIIIMHSNGYHYLHLFERVEGRWEEMEGFPITYNWPQIKSDPSGYPLVGDLDTDFENEILVSMDGGGTLWGELPELYAYNSDGSIVQRFPKKIDDFLFGDGVVMEDIDGDGKNEFIAYTWKGHLFVWDSDGEAKNNEWPVFHHDPWHTGNYHACKPPTTKLISLDGKINPPFYINNLTPEILISGEANMRCRWGDEDLIYSQMPTSNECLVEGSNAICQLTDQGEDGEKKVYISCQDDFGNDQSIYQNLDVAFTLDTKKPKVLLATASPNPAKAGEVTITIVFTDEGLGLNPETINPEVTITGLKTTYSAIPSVISKEGTFTWIGKFNLLDEEEERVATISVKNGPKDLAGNLMDDNLYAGSFVVDTISPSKPIITDPTSDLAMNADSYTIKGIAELNALVELKRIEDELTRSQQLTNKLTTFSFEIPLIENATNSFMVYAYDAARNKSEEVIIKIVEDGIPPQKPSIDPITSPTYESTQLISGTKESFTSVWLNNSKILDLDEKTNWSYQLSLSLGENPISITLKDRALNESPPVNASITKFAHSVIIPTPAPIPLPPIEETKPPISPIPKPTPIPIEKPLPFPPIKDKEIKKEIIGKSTISPLEGGKITAVSIEGSTASVEIPAKVIKEDTKIVITPIRREKTSVNLPPRNSFIVGKYIYKFLATAKEKPTSFPQSATITFTYTDKQIKELDELNLIINFWNESTKKWIPLKTEVNPKLNTLTTILTTATQPTYFAAIGKVDKKIDKKEIKLPKIPKERFDFQIPFRFKFERPLRFRDRHIEVKYLQAFLKAQGPEIYPEARLTGYFDLATLKAVCRFQRKHRLVAFPINLRICGYVGPATRAKINKMLKR